MHMHFSSAAIWAVLHIDIRLLHAYALAKCNARTVAQHTVLRPPLMEPSGANGLVYTWYTLQRVAAPATYLHNNIIIFVCPARLR